MKVKFDLIDAAESYRALFTSMMEKRLAEIVGLISVTISLCKDARVPYSVVITTGNIQTQAVSSNILAAFTQSLSRMESKLGT